MAATRLASKTRIYLDVKQMLDITIGVVKNFPKSQRPIFGDRLCNMLIDSLNHIAKAQRSECSYRTSRSTSNRSRSYIDLDRYCWRTKVDNGYKQTREPPSFARGRRKTMHSMERITP